MSNQKVEHVFILMLENHSFDNIFGFSGIKGIKTATGENSYAGTTYPLNADAPESMLADPGHEFADTLQQLCGSKAGEYVPFKPYPSVMDLSGFVANFATSTTEDKVEAHHPCPEQYGDVMKCFGNKVKLPAIWELATEFAVCDRWFSSMPGPTWPNRFFAYAASSGSLDDSPSPWEMLQWEGPDKGIEFLNGSIFSLIKKPNYRLYQHNFSQTSFPIVLGIKGLHLEDMHDLSTFKSDLQTGYTYPLTLIEPNYGSFLLETYKGGSSQHPMDGIRAGEDLIKQVYEAIRGVQEVWEKSLLIITYDEHGGFYDSVPPPGGAKAPGDSDHLGGPFNYNGFTFEQYGVRVPAVVVSPFIPRNTVCSTLFDHTSMLKTVEELFGLTNLTERDKHANSLVPLLTLDTIRQDCPTSLAAIAGPEPEEVLSDSLSDEALEVFNNTPLPEKGNVYGFLAIANKADHELSGGTEAEKLLIDANFKAISTKGQARDYMTAVLTKARNR